MIGGCSGFVSLDGLRVEDGGTMPDGATGMDVVMVPDTAPPADGGMDADTGPSCPALEGPTMIRTPDGCIDSTEVTRGQYAKFLSAGVDVSKQGAACAWNSTFVPGGGDQSKLDLPVGQVDWCDAYAYCKWAGKNLCGDLSGMPLPFQDNSVFDSTKARWIRACNAAGTRKYSYGLSYDQTACNTIDLQTGDVAAVGTMPKCVGGYPGLFDMIGNVAEWIDSCDDNTGDGGPNEDPCRHMGASFDYPDPNGQGHRATCDFDDYDWRESQYTGLGIRCCL
jgi:formylglycine-generating enzyme required for sulfatase activity